MNLRRILAGIAVGLSGLIGCSTAPAPVLTPTPELIAPTIVSSPRPVPTIAIGLRPTLPPIIVTNPLPTVTPWPTPTPDWTATAIQADGEATVTRAALNTPIAIPTCPSAQPTPAVQNTQAAVQHFEHGLMIWLQVRAEIWVLIDSPTSDYLYWRVLPDLWSDGLPVDDPALHAPPGLYQPVRGFGYAWRIGSGSQGPQRAELGWATDEETGFATALIYYGQGFYTPDCQWQPKSGILELKDQRGTVYQFYGEGAVGKVLPPP